MRRTQGATLHATVRGRVQGVGFRQFVQGHAAQLGLAGWVRNRPDGSVELMAGGDQEVIHQLIEELRSGPPAARVEELDVAWSEENGLPNPFQIRA